VNEKKELDLRDHKVIRDLLKLKEKVIRVRKRKDGSEDDSNIDKKFLLPDGSLISIDAKMIYEPMEMMFDDTTDVNSLSNENGGSKPIKTMINETIMKCDQDIMKTLRDNIVVGGGNSMPEGFRDRMRNEVDDAVLEFDP
jgi:centractin